MQAGENSTSDLRNVFKTEEFVFLQKNFSEKQT